MGLNGSLDVLVELVRGVRVRAAGRGGAADFLAAEIGQVDVAFLLGAVEVIAGPEDAGPSRMS